MRTFFNGLSGIQRKITWLLLFSIASLCLVGWLIFSNKANMKNERYWIDHTYSVIEQIERIDSEMAEGEAYSLQYSISGADTLKARMAESHGLLEQYLTRLEELTEDNVLQRTYLRELSGYTHQLGIFVDSIVYLGTAVIDRPSAGMKAAAMIHRMKGALRSMMREERNLLTQRQAARQSNERGSTYMLITGSALAFLFIVVILLQLNRDIVLRKNAEKNLLQSELKYRMLIENAGAVIYSTNEEGYITFVSAKAMELTGYSAEALQGKHFSMLIDPASLREVRKHYFNQLKSGVRETSFSFRILTRDKEIKWVEQFAVLLLRRGKPAGFQCIVRDISETHRMKEELERSRAHYQQQLIAATREAQAAKGMQEQFLANMSHEIRTPMNGIQGMTNLLRETVLTEGQKEFVDIIKLSADNLLVIINDILDFSKIKAGKLAIEKIDFRLKDVLENVKAIFIHRVKKKGLAFHLSTDARLPHLMKGDPYRLNQVLINLIGNAIKFTERGAVTLKVDLQQRTAEHAELLFTVMDTGIGIPAERLPEIFDNFSQAGLDISRKYGGTGLGLAISKQLVQLQGGNIQVESEAGKGSVFSFSLSYGNSEREETASGRAATAMTDHSQLLTGRRFLVAEDNVVNQKLVEYVLTKAGGIVQLANDGREAVDLLLQDNGYDLVIMDLQMPVMDGYGATKLIRDELKLQIPIIAMTATALVGEQVRCLDAGVDEYMTKPFDFKELYKKIAGLLDGRSALPLFQDAGAMADELPAYDLSLLRQMDDRHYLWDRLNAFISESPGRIAEMRGAALGGEHEQVVYRAGRMKRSARVLQAHVLHSLLAQIEVQSREGDEVAGLVQMVQDVYEGMEPLLKEEIERIGFVLSPEE
ncbi:ATP-binding protein [Flavitalea sp. BT771]|uniref:hybrid sensor histidine kinase/response regulator n=1 Tax=Flavitalea sp. BT771 TaxID=3063329 RepID=UPI0026E3A54F|nr:ATP-binding protein [Flavitalea sp. BT771]MDO6434869.1 ATP-binding protein [Flavitalea sp. BT771]MDV6223769.1 ATP-binding protein [Flavitalea sp. BT771]